MINPVKANKVTPLHDGVIVSNMNFGERKLASGLILASDDGKSAGVRPRWGQVHSIGPEQKDVTVGQWVCLAHGRWSRAFELQNDQGVVTKLWKADPESILLVSDEQPEDYGDSNPEAVY